MSISKPESIESTEQFIKRVYLHWIQGLFKGISALVKIFSFPSIFLLIKVLAAYSGFFNILLSSLGTLYQRVYNFPETTAGYGYIPIGLGVICGLFYARKLTQTFAKLLPKSLSGKTHKNYLVIFVLSLFIASAGWILFGWACEKRLHWAVSMAGLLLYGAAGTIIKV